jgi:tetratricopeptide (TPR) repeat protein
MVRRVKLTAPTYYWGDGGLYGPFDVQQDGPWIGWPDFGQVLRYFREKASVTIQEFCQLYGDEVNGDGRAVSERWILKMELNNKVPVDMNKRQTLAKLFQIPPMLFGLAVLEDLTLEPRTQNWQTFTTIKQTTLPRVTVDTTNYQANNQVIWQLHETSNALSSFRQVITDIQNLECLMSQTQGDLHYHIQEILLSDQILATHIVRDQGQFNAAYHYANAAVHVAQQMHDHDLLATALYTRGQTALEWGVFGQVAQGRLQIQQDKLQNAIRDFQTALALFPQHNRGESMHPQLFGLISVFLYRAQMLLAVIKKEQVPLSVFASLDSIEQTVNQQNIEDPHTRVLVTGTRTGWKQAGYLDNRATVFLIAGYSGKALQELSALEGLTEQTYKQDATRQFTWLDILKANAYMGLENFDMATQHAKKALLSCQDICSVTNMAIIADLHGRLLESRYKTSSDVLELGDILREAPITSLVKQ